MTPEELAARRRRLGLNQTELALLIGVTQNTISRWETKAMAIEAPRSLWLDQEMQRVEREHRRPRGRPPRRGARRASPGAEGAEG